MKRTFSVQVSKSLNRRSDRVISLDFDSGSINFHKVRKGQEFKRAFGFQSCIKLEKSNSKEPQLTLIFGPDQYYNKVFIFKSIEERDLCCNLIHAVIVTGQRALEQFHINNAGQAKNSSVENFCDFLIQFAAEQSNLAENNSAEAPQQQLNSAVELVVNADSPLSGSSIIESDGFTLFPHERIILSQPHVLRLLDPAFDSSDAATQLDNNSRGNLFVTDYRLIYRDYAVSQNSSIPWNCDLLTEIPFGQILKLEKLNVKKIQSSIRIYCKNYYRVEFCFDANESWIDGFVEQITRMAFPKDQTKLFAFAAAKDSQYNSPAKHHPSISGSSPAAASLIDSSKGKAEFSFASYVSHTGYDPIKDYERLELIGNSSFRLIKDLNANFELCQNYPPFFIVPSALSDEEIREVAKFRSQGRMPITVFQHPITRATVTRCAQPLSGLKGKRCEEDEKLFALIREANTSNSESLYIIDARPYKAAMGNTVMGKGYESTNYYTQCKIEFMNIDNIHAIRNSLDRLVDCVYNESRSESENGWMARIESTQWLYYVRLLLQAAVRCCCLLTDDGCSTVVHCSDGWDRTSQLCALVELMLDSHYRSLVGFSQLMEKEWLSMGHKFSERHGHADGNFSHDQRAPIWIQFLDCVYQLIYQFPTAFEFNEAFLVELAEQTINCRFGTFLFDSVKERVENGVYSNTDSVWSLLLAEQNRSRFTNLLYVPVEKSMKNELANAAAARKNAKNAANGNSAATANNAASSSVGSQVSLSSLGSLFGVYCIPSTSPKRLQFWSRFHQRFDRHFALQLKMLDVKAEKKLGESLAAQKLVNQLHQRENGIGWKEWSPTERANYSISMSGFERNSQVWSFPIDGANASAAAAASAGTNSNAHDASLASATAASGARSTIVHNSIATPIPISDDADDDNEEEKFYSPKKGENEKV